MTQPADVERYRENWQDEVDSAAEYRAMASSETDPKIAKVYSNLAKMEEAHIGFWEERLRAAGGKIGERRPSCRVRLVPRIANRRWAAAGLPATHANAGSRRDCCL